VEDRISGLKDKKILKEELLAKESKVVKGIHKNSATPSKHQTCKSWT
jgi:hypothetical protein